MPQVALVGLMAAGAATSAIGNIMSADANAKADLFNANKDDQQAALVNEQTQLKESQQVYSDKETIGSIRAAYGASGISMDGTPTQVLEQNAAMAQMNEVAITHQGTVESQMYTDQAQQYRTAADSITQGGILGAIGNAITGGTKIAATQINFNAGGSGLTQVAS